MLKQVVDTVPLLTPCLLRLRSNCRLLNLRRLIVLAIVDRVVLKINEMVNVEISFRKSREKYDNYTR